MKTLAIIISLTFAGQALALSKFNINSSGRTLKNKIKYASHNEWSCRLSNNYKSSVKDLKLEAGSMGVSGSLQGSEIFSEPAIYSLVMTDKLVWFKVHDSISKKSFEATKPFPKRGGIKAAKNVSITLNTGGLDRTHVSCKKL